MYTFDIVGTGSTSVYNSKDPSDWLNLGGSQSYYQFTPMNCKSVTLNIHSLYQKTVTIG